MKPSTPPPARITTLVLGLALAGTLAGCVPLVVGGAVGTAVVAADRRTSGAQLEDQAIEIKGGRRVRDALGEQGRVNITSFNRTVLLSGEVATDADKAAAEAAVAGVENVRAVVNELAIGPNHTLTGRSNDLLIAGNVRARLIEARDLHANAYKIVVERNVVYLMGRVTEREARRGTDVARDSKGVEKVVKVFEVISEEELAQLEAPRSGAAR